MTPAAYIQNFPRDKRMAERKRLARVAGCSLHAMRHYTEETTLEDGSRRARRYPQDAEVCKRLSLATREMVGVADWNPAFAPLVKP